MKILVIGNGFDLAHELPTKYNDFLDFLTLIIKMSRYSSTTVDFISKQLNESFANIHIKNYIHNLIKEITEEYKRNNENAVLKFLSLNTLVNKSENKVLRELIEYTEGNVWYEHFVIAKSYINEGWIDFESEISRVIQLLEKYKSNGLFELQDLEEKETKKIVLSVSTPDGNSKKFRVDEKLIQNLELDLNKLIRSLELYLEECVGKINIDHILPDIYGQRFTKILSFNYTNTFKKIYEPYLMKLTYAPSQLEYDFIHGKSNIENDLETNNMVLGIDEYLNNMETNQNTSFIFFKKYFQRIHKETGCEYKDWVSNIRSSHSPTELYIFGHSLDITDKDVIRELILSNNVKTTIFYYNKKVYASQIANLVKVLGKDDLISRVHGSKRSITFKQQEGLKSTTLSETLELIVPGN
ncbi:AbiH family protein [Paenibacillus xylanilyticus]|uniref:Bacteriophage abortive infection AbiH n=1 Tax=Paenibacillus xylanilyticus TaxID=248903 RepID=A0A7Y6BTA6_9BACL|nr:AbiH family protein [Paenibacillus xylanilyticus]NUU74623.1 hypothetical protein [Paenibacillus xylanilyticus]